MLNPKDPNVLARCEEILQDCGLSVESQPDAIIAAEMMQTIVRLISDDPGRGEMRMILRTLKELRYALKTFKPYRHRRKISMFGSARTPVTDPDYLLAEETAKLAAEAGFMIITGAGPGIMAAGNAGAGQANSFGVAIKLPFEQTTNPAIEGNDKLVHFRYFFTRKIVFVKETHAIMLFPGGFGTHDEGFEVLTLVQTGRADPMPIVMVEKPGGDYWQDWNKFVRRQLLDKRMISPEDECLYHITNNARDAVDHVQRFYVNYQSLRYVQDDLVMRLRHTPTEQELDTLNTKFSDILTSGSISLSNTTKAEPVSTLPAMPCLVMKFDRRSVARFRQMIDAINTLPSLPPMRELTSDAPEVGGNEGDRNVGQIADEEGIKIAGPGT